jgi:phosphotriesterase-related protein
MPRRVDARQRERYAYHAPAGRNGATATEVAPLATIPTATGAIDSADLGFTYMHEHVIVGTPGLYDTYPHLWKRDEYLKTAVQKLTEARERGVRSMVDLTPADFHRDIRFVQEASRQSGVQIVMATGIYWRSTPYFDGHPIDALLPLLLHDIHYINEGMQGTDVRAGILKAATDEPGVTLANEKALRTVARAHRATGVPISTHTNAHLEMGTKQQDVFESEGVDLGRVVIGHSGDSTDTGYLERLIERGSYIGMDRFGLHLRHLPSFEESSGHRSEDVRQGLCGSHGAVARRRLHFRLGARTVPRVSAPLALHAHRRGGHSRSARARR